jgi:lipopolysaccharide transport system permease protein
MTVTAEPTAVPPVAAPPVIVLGSNPSFEGRLRAAIGDLLWTGALWRLWTTLAWLDVKARYRGSLLGPLWATLSTGLMVAGIGALYSSLFRVPRADYVPFIALSLVLWNYLSGLVIEACHCFVRHEPIIRSTRLPLGLYAARTVVNALILLLHSALVVVVVFIIYGIWPGVAAWSAIPAFLLWIANSVACCLLLGTLSARFRDIPPIVASMIQFVFFITPVIWTPESLGIHQWALVFNPAYCLLEIVRAPLMGAPAKLSVWLAALGYSAVLIGVTGVVFARLRSRIAYWI